MYFQTTVAEIWLALLILFDLLKNAVCIPCPINNNFELEAHCCSRPQQLLIDTLAIQWPPFDPMTISTPWMVQLAPGGQYRPLWEPLV